MVLECHASIQRAIGGRVCCRAPSTRQHAWAKLKPNEGRPAKGSKYVSRESRREPEPAVAIRMAKQDDCLATAARAASIPAFTSDEPQPLRCKPGKTASGASAGQRLHRDLRRWAAMPSA